MGAVDKGHDDEGQTQPPQKGKDCALPQGEGRAVVFQGLDILLLPADRRSGGVICFALNPKKGLGMRVLRVVCHVEDPVDRWGTPTDC